MPRLPLVACRNVNLGEEEEAVKKPAQLTPKQKRFVSEYLIDLNASAAARRVGYADRSARVTGQRLLQNPAIVEAIASNQSRLATKLEVNAEKVLAEIAKMGFANMMDYITVTPGGDAVVDLKALDRDKAAAIQEVTVEEYTEGRGEDARNVKRVKFKLADKRANLELLGKNLRLFTEKVELTGKDGGPIQATNVPPEEAYKRMLGGG